MPTETARYECVLNMPSYRHDALNTAAAYNSCVKTTTFPKKWQHSDVVFCQLDSTFGELAEELFGEPID